MIDRRSNQIVLPFTFWDIADPGVKRDPKGLYEMRTYTLRPGTLIEWGQAWYVDVDTWVWACIFCTTYCGEAVRILLL